MDQAAAEEVSGTARAGAVAGSVEVTLQQPLVGVKNALQVGWAVGWAGQGA
jgi:hypothetical protein